MGERTADRAEVGAGVERSGADGAVWEPLRREIAHLLSTRVGLFGFALHDAATGEGFAVNGDTVFNTASVIKTPIMIEVYRQATQGRFSLNDPIAMRAEHQVGGTGVLALFHAGLEVSVRDAAVAMIVLSDNTATNMLLDLAGIEPVNETMRKLGLKHTVCRHDIAFTPGVDRGPLGVTTPNEMNRLNALLALNEAGAAGDSVRERAGGDAARDVLQPEDCADMLDILSFQQDRAAIPRYIPRVVDHVTNRRTPRICHKTGSMTGIRNDSGLLYVPNGPCLAFSAFCCDVPDTRWTPDHEALLVWAEVGKRVWDYFSRPLDHVSPRSATIPK